MDWLTTVWKCLEIDKLQGTYRITELRVWYYISTWSSDLLEKLTVANLVKKITPRLLCSPMIYYFQEIRFFKLKNMEQSGFWAADSRLADKSSVFLKPES
jgi:hypothetical protein